MHDPPVCGHALALTNPVTCCLAGFAYLSKGYGSFPLRKTRHVTVCKGGFAGIAKSSGQSLRLPNWSPSSRIFLARKNGFGSGEGPTGN